MRAVLQRVTRASVSIDGQSIARIDGGMLVLLGIARGDTVEGAHWLAAKTAGLRIFPSLSLRAGTPRPGGFERSLAEVGGTALVVSQFTLLADVRKGRRPSFADAAGPDEAVPLIDAFVEALREAGVRVETGRFGAQMTVELVNDGPVTIVLDTADLEKPRRA